MFVQPITWLLAKYYGEARRFHAEFLDKDAIDKTGSTAGDRTNV